MSKLTLQLISRKNCHLCDEMLNNLNKYKDDFFLEIIYLDENLSLESVYGSKVPVLLNDGVEICHYFLDSCFNDLILKNKCT